MPKDTSQDLHLQHFLPYQLYVLASRISHALAKHYEDQFQISRPEWRIIAVLGEHPNLSAAEVAERTAMDKVAVSRAVTKLLKNQLLDRRFASQDKRRSALSLSRSGQAIYKKIVPIALEYEKKILQQLNKGELKLLDSMITKLGTIELDFD